MKGRVSYMSRHAAPPPARISFRDRLLGALLAAIGLTVSIIVAPTLLYMNIDPLTSWSYFGRTGMAHWFVLWALWVAVFAAAGGLIAGYERTLEFMSHLWFTADEPNRGFSVMLWVVLVLLGVATFLILSAIPAGA